MEKAHSEEFFGPARDHWWNQDFVALMARRWDLASVHSVLDLGCGMGHWGRTLLPHLPGDVELTGLDLEPTSVAAANRHATPRCRYVVGNIQSLPFEDASFDMVTCQTVLIHVPDVEAVLREAVRVLKPGGLLAVAEPNNISACLVETSFSFDDSLSSKLERIRFAMTCERGKAILGGGHDSVGDLMPGLFQESGLSDIKVYVSDKASPYLPPYDTTEQRDNMAQLAEWENSDFYGWNRDTALRYFQAGGGDDSEFDTLWDRWREFWHGFRAALLARTLHTGGGSLCYLVSGRKKKG